MHYLEKGTDGQEEMTADEDETGTDGGSPEGRGSPGVGGESEPRGFSVEASVAAWGKAVPWEPGESSFAQVLGWVWVEPLHPALAFLRASVP